MPDTTRDQTPPRQASAAVRNEYREEQDERSGDQDMSTRTMLMLGGIMTVGVAAVLGMTTLAGLVGRAGSPTPVKPAVVTSQNGSAVETVAPQGPIPSDPVPTRGGAITPHVAVPPTQGLDQQAARVRLRATRLIVASVLRVPSELPTGRVVRTFPAAGTGLPIGGQVTLYVSTGLPAVAQVTIPYLRGLTLPQARLAAARFGLSVEVTHGTGTVAAQIPEPGSVAPRGAEIAVVLQT